MINPFSLYCIFNYIMAKKCIPGVLCIENMTLAVFMFLFILLAYLYYVFIVKVNNQTENKQTEKIIVYQPQIPIRSAPNVILDPYGPPLRDDGTYFPRDSGDIRGIPLIRGGIPINIETRGVGQDYSQIGILTRTNTTDMILPLMGRRLVSGLDKWQYYTISNTGNMNTKLPVSLKGKSCSGEYGCDCINNGDMVYVEGYNDTFKVTVYENSRFNYIPYI
jgi:Family of unknown function (DUF5755)